MEQLLIAQLMQEPLETENPGLHWVHTLLGQVVQLASVQGIMHCPVTEFKVPFEQTAQKLGWLHELQPVTLHCTQVALADDVAAMKEKPEKQLAQTLAEEQLLQLMLLHWMQIVPLVEFDREYPLLHCEQLWLALH